MRCLYNCGPAAPPLQRAGNVGAMSQVQLHATKCAICRISGNATELYPANLDFADFNPEVFSARRLPDRIHYRMVKCRACGLVRSDPVADAATLSDLYRQSTFDYGTEVANLRRTYGRYLALLDEFGVHHGSLLEIGCGNGFFLEEARAHGYEDVRGVEPGAAAIARAAPEVRDRIVCDIMRPGLFTAETFNVVCLFQVFDHLPDPAGTLAEACRVLKPGGLALIYNHNIDALSAHILGERSPIIDIEHTFLYGLKTLGILARAHGFEIVKQGHALNDYSLRYLVRLVPMPGAIKRGMLKLLAVTRLEQINFRVPLGNLFVIARKRGGANAHG